MKNKVIFLFIALCMSVGSLAKAEVILTVQPEPEGVDVRLTNIDRRFVEGWLLQFSKDSETWEGVTFFPKATTRLSLEWRGFDESDGKKGFFRVVQPEGDQTFYRRFLSERLKWRLSGSSDYRYELQQDFGSLSWRGNVNVEDDMVSSFERIFVFPEFFGDPDIPTIDGLFERIAQAIEQNAASIDVTWDEQYGYPKSGYIDLDSRIADEEYGWLIASFSPDLPD